MPTRVPSSAAQILLCLLLGPISLSAQAKGPENGSRAASGIVVLETTEQPIRHAQVEFVDAASGWATATLTDRHGRFTVAGLALTEYRLTVTAPGYERLESAVAIAPNMQRLLFRLRKTSQPATPRNQFVVSARELRMSGKAASAFEKGARLLQKGQPQNSVAYFERAIALEPGYYLAYHDLGLAQYRLGNSDSAELDFQKSIELSNGGYAPPQFALAMILSERQQFRQAESLLQNGLAMEPGSAVGKYFLALVQLAQNRTAEAEKSARDALWRNASQADAYIVLAKVHEREHNAQAVIADVTAYLSLDPHGRLKNEASDLQNRAELEIRTSQ